MKDAREWMLRVGMDEKMHFQKNGEDGKSVIVDPSSVYTSDLMNGWAKNELKELTADLKEAYESMIDIEHQFDSEFMDKIKLKYQGYLE